MLQLLSIDAEGIYPSHGLGVPKLNPLAVALAAM